MKAFPHPLLRAGAIGFALLFAILIVWDWARNFWAPNFTDFLSFWAAGKLSLGGDPAAAYDVARHRAMELTIVKFKELMPFAYPPPFLLLVTPFAMLQYHWALAAWVVATGLVFLVATRRVISAPFALAHPPVLMNGAVGQNGFLTTAIFTVGTSLLRERPFAAGLILGMLVIKPQLALLLPVAVIAARLWPAIGGAVVSSGALLLLSLLLLGSEAFQGFVAILPLYKEMLGQGSWQWNEFITVFAFLRYFGVDQGIALGIHAVVALGAAAITWIAWSRSWPEQVPILAAASLLVPPYLLTYDALLLVIPMGYWLHQRPRPYAAAGLWLLCALPIAFYFNLYRGPNTIPLAAIASVLLLAGARRRSSTGPTDVNDADLVRV